MRINNEYLIQPEYLIEGGKVLAGLGATMAVADYFFQLDLPYTITIGVIGFSCCTIGDYQQSTDGKIALIDYLIGKLFSSL